MTVKAIVCLVESPEMEQITDRLFVSDKLGFHMVKYGMDMVEASQSGFTRSRTRIVKDTVLVPEVNKIVAGTVPTEKTDFSDILGASFHRRLYESVNISDDAVISNGLYVLQEENLLATGSIAFESQKTSDEEVSNTIEMSESIVTVRQRFNGFDEKIVGTSFFN